MPRENVSVFFVSDSRERIDGGNWRIWMMCMVTYMPSSSPVTRRTYFNQTISHPRVRSKLLIKSPSGPSHSPSSLSIHGKGRSRDRFPKLQAWRKRSFLLNLNESVPRNAELTHSSRFRTSSDSQFLTLVSSDSEEKAKAERAVNHVFGQYRC
jgi:hypothetical protein